MSATVRDWEERANCRRTGVNFHPESHDRVAVWTAKLVCAACQVRQPCLECALRRGERGIWGGTTEEERVRLTREARSAGEAKPRRTSMATTRGTSDRVPIEVVDEVGDAEPVAGTAAVQRDEISREITGIADLRGDDGRPLSRAAGTRVVLKLHTGEVPRVDT